MQGNDAAGENVEARRRWRAIYAGVAAVTLLLIIALIAFSRYFGA